MNAYIAANRLTVRLEALSRFLLGTTAASWLCYIIYLQLIPAGDNGERGGPIIVVLALGVLLVVPLRLFLRQGALRRLQLRWNKTDRQSRKGLLDMAEAIDNEAGLLSHSQLRELRQNLLEALSALPPNEHNQISTQILQEIVLGESLNDGEKIVLAARALSLQKKFPADRLLVFWNLAAARGFSAEQEELEKVLERVGKQSLGVAPNEYLPVLYTSLRENWKDADTLLIRLLREKKLRTSRVPADLRNRLHKHPLCPPDLRSDLGPKVLRRNDESHQKTDGSSSGLSFAKFPRENLARQLTWLAVIVVVLVGVRFLPRMEAPNAAENHTKATGPLWQAPENTVDDANAYTIQVLASKDSLYAITEAKRLLQEGLWSFVQRPRENSRWYRVRLGWFPGRSEADSIAVDLLERAVIKDRYTANFSRADIVWQPDEED